MKHFSLDQPMRLSKRMAQLGICSRREADSYIEKGWVLINGKPAILGQKVHHNDRIDLDKRAHQRQAQRVTILLNKPVGYVSNQAEKGYHSAAELIHAASQWQGDHSKIQFQPQHLHGLAPAGRLDIDSVGLLVLTQDGRIAKQLIDAHSQREKEYLVRIEGHLSAQGLALLNHGLILDNEPLRPAQVSWQNAEQLRFILKQGKKRQIRRMCELVGLRVTKLQRIRIGKVKLGALPIGQWRYLSPNETF